MAYREDIKSVLSAAVGRRRPDYTVTVYGDRAAAVEYRGKLTYFDGGRIRISAGKAAIEITGEGLEARESGDGQLFVKGALTKVEVIR